MCVTLVRALALFCFLSNFDFFLSFLHHRQSSSHTRSSIVQQLWTHRRSVFNASAAFSFICVFLRVHYRLPRIKFIHSNKLFILFIIYILNRSFSLRARSYACMFSLELFSFFFFHVMTNDLESIIYFKIKKWTRKRKIQSFALARNKFNSTDDKRRKIGNWANCASSVNSTCINFENETTTKLRAKRFLHQR